MEPKQPELLSSTKRTHPSAAVLGHVDTQTAQQKLESALKAELLKLCRLIAECDDDADC